jgi:hypothetical protein
MRQIGFSAFYPVLYYEHRFVGFDIKVDYFDLFTKKDMLRVYTLQ